MPAFGRLPSPLVDLLVDTKTELLELALRSGLEVFTTMLEEDRKVIAARLGRSSEARWRWDIRPAPGHPYNRPIIPRWRQDR